MCTRSKYTFLLGLVVGVALTYINLTAYINIASKKSTIKKCKGSVMKRVRPIVFGPVEDLTTFALRSMLEKKQTAEGTSQLDGRGQALIRIFRKLKYNKPRNYQERSEVKHFLDVAVEALPLPFQSARVALVPGPYTTFILASTAVLAGATIVFNERSGAGCPDLSNPWEICWVDGFLGGQYGMGTGNALRHVSKKQIFSPIPNIYSVLGEGVSLFRSLMQASRTFQDDQFAHVMPRAFEIPKHRRAAVAAVESAEISTHWVARREGKKKLSRHFNKEVAKHLKAALRKNYTVRITEQKPWLIREVVQPLLLNQRRFSVRLHVFVRLNPLRIYVHDSMAVHLASEQYIEGLEHFSNQCMQEPDQVFQQLSCPKYIPNDDARQKQSQRTHLWSKQAFVEYLETSSISAKKIQKEIEHLIILTIFSIDMWQVKNLKDRKDKSFSLLGATFSVDKSGNPFLENINTYPSTAIDTPGSFHEKIWMLTDMWRIVGVGGYDRSGRGYKKRVEERISKFCRGKVCDGSKFHRELLWQYEDEQQYKGTWQLVFPTKSSIAEHDQRYSKKSIPGHYNEFLREYVVEKR